MSVAPVQSCSRRRTEPVLSTQYLGTCKPHALLRILNFIMLIRIALSFFLFPLSLLAQSKSPNVLFIAVDDLNDWVGFMGGYPGEVKTPHLDRLAKMGTAFTNAHTASPVCCPSRVAVLSGQLPTTSGIYNNRHWWKPNIPDLVTIPAHFRSNGYTVVGAGKIFHHTAGNNPPESWDHFQRLDFHDDAFARPRRDLFPYLMDQKKPEDFPFSGIALYSDEVDWAGLDKPESEFDDARAAQYGIDFLENHEGDPFFLACGFFRPHMPWYFPKTYLDLYPLDQIRVPPDLPEDLEDVPEAGKQIALRKYVDMKKTRDAGKWPSAIQHYLASISFMDAQLGRLLDALESSPHADNTIIVLWSDHGWHLGEKQHWHKRTLWEESTRVPLVVVTPGAGRPGQICPQPASLLDLFPTLIEFCQLTALENQPLDGISLKPWLLDPEKRRTRSVITVHESKHVSIRSAQYRYIKYSDGSEELYDLYADPNEWDNQIGNPALTEVLKRLSSEVPASFAPEAKSYTQFDFNPHEYTWRDKKTGEVTTGDR